MLVQMGYTQGDTWDTEIPGYWGYRGHEIQECMGYRGTGIQGDTDTGILGIQECNGYRATEILGMIEIQVCHHSPLSSRGLPHVPHHIIFYMGTALIELYQS